MRKGVGTFGPSTWSSVGGGIRVQTAGLSLLRPLLAMGILLPVVLLQGCIKNPFAVFNPAAPEVSASPESPPEDSAVAPSPILGKKVVLPSGLMYIDLVLGTGPSPGPGNLVTVHYTQTLDDGRTFDSSREREPLTFRWGVGDVIPGWDEGLKTMRQGGRLRLPLSRFSESPQT